MPGAPEHRPIARELPAECDLDADVGPAKGDTIRVAPLRERSPTGTREEVHPRGYRSRRKRRNSVLERVLDLTGNGRLTTTWAAVAPPGRPEAHLSIRPAPSTSGKPISIVPGRRGLMDPRRPYRN